MTHEKDGLYEFKFHLLFGPADNYGFGCRFEVRQNGVESRPF